MVLVVVRNHGVSWGPIFAAWESPVEHIYTVCTYSLGAVGGRGIVRYRRHTIWNVGGH